MIYKYIMLGWGGEDFRWAVRCNTWGGKVRCNSAAKNHLCTPLPEAAKHATAVPVINRAYKGNERDSFGPREFDSHQNTLGR